MFVKRGDRVEAEAAALTAAGHPGVVELVGVTDGALHTASVEGRALADAGPLTPDEVAGVTAAVASTLADLHERGVVHGGLDATHVLLGDDGRVVLCSLGRGGDPSDDVAALGRLVSGLLAAGPADAPPRPEARPRTGWPRRARPLGPMLAPLAAPTLAALAAQATDPDPGRRPTAREVADAVRRRVPTARLPRPASRPLLPVPPPPARRRARRPAAAAALTTGAAVALVAGGWWVLAGPGEGQGPTADAPAAVRRPRPSIAPRRMATAPPASAPVATRVWPEEPLEVRDGVVSVDGARYAVGAPGDAVVAGDWACTGRRTLALLRPGTGEVFAFDEWATEAEEAVARPVGRVDGANGLRAADTDGDGCHDLRVQRVGGPEVHVEMRP